MRIATTTMPAEPKQYATTTMPAEPKQFLPDTFQSSVLQNPVEHRIYLKNTLILYYNL